MADLDKINGFDATGAELMAAVGVENTGLLALREVHELLGELTDANRHLRLVDELPSSDLLADWISQAREIEGLDEAEPVARLENVVARVPINVPVALPVEKEDILRGNIQVSEVPVMSDFVADDELFEERQITTTVRKEEMSASVDTVTSVASVAEPKPRARAKKTAKHDPLGIQSSPEAKERASSEERPKVEPLKRSSGFDIRKTASPELNVGRTPHSRWYIRGVLHPTPFKVRVGAFFSIIVLILLPLTFVAGGSMLYFKENLELVKMLAIVPVVFLVSGLAYLLFSRPPKCRICGQALFVPKTCRRNPKAHHIPLLGYILPTSFQILIFKWFRCIYCGTAVRIKK